MTDPVGTATTGSSATIGTTADSDMTATPAAATATPIAVPVITKLSNKELRQHTLLQQQKIGIPLTSTMMNRNKNDEERSVDSSTGAAYHIPIHQTNHHHHPMNPEAVASLYQHNHTTMSASVRSGDGRLSVISDVKADIAYDCDGDDDDDDDNASKGGIIGQTEEEDDDDDSPSSSPQKKGSAATGGSNIRGKRKTRRRGQHQRSKQQQRVGGGGVGHSNDESSQSNEYNNDYDTFWTKQNIRLAVFLVLLFTVVTIAIVIVVLLTTTGTSDHSSSTTSPTGANDGMIGNSSTSNDFDSDTTGSNSSDAMKAPNTSPMIGVELLRPSQLYNEEMVQSIYQTLIDITSEVDAINNMNNNNNIDKNNTTASVVVWDDPTSSHVLARDWILYVDTYLASQQQSYNNNAEDNGGGTNSDTTTTTSFTWMDRLLQRYALVQLYYATNGPYWMVSGSNETMMNNGEMVVNFVNPTTSECTWTGVTCDDTKRRRYLQQVRRSTQNNNNNNILQNDSLNYHHRFLSSSAAAAASMLSQPQHEIDVDLNMISRMMQEGSNNYYGLDGTINKVFRLYFQSTNMTGTIPNELGRCIQKLSDLDLSQNAMYGTIPYTLFTPDTLWDESMGWLDLSSNNFIGSIPSNIWNLHELRFLFLNDNELTGQIERQDINSDNTNNSNNSTTNVTEDDSSISNDTNGTINDDDEDSSSVDQVGEKRSNLLRQIQIHKNELSGSMPNWFHELSDLEQFIAYDNHLTGPLPDPIPGSLILFDVSFNKISGTIPIKFWSESDSPTKIERMYLDNNQLMGTIPNSTQLRQDMQRLWLNDNYLLTGTIPKFFGYAWSRLSELQLHHTNLIGQLGPVMLDDDSGGVGTTNSTICRITWPNWTTVTSNCLQRMKTDVPPVSCECCTFCANQNVTIRRRRRKRRRRQ